MSRSIWATTAEYLPISVCQDSPASNLLNLFLSILSFEVLVYGPDLRPDGVHSILLPIRLIIRASFRKPGHRRFHPGHEYQILQP
jgi:hypothetical protein